jgi:hypothetical protein
MSKFGCTCGADIIDQTDNLAHKGFILKDQDRDVFFEKVTDEVAGYIDAVRNGTTQAWFAAHPTFRSKPDAWIVNLLLFLQWIKVKVEMYECPECGRLWVQKSTETQEFASFVREEPGERVLPSEHYRPSAG